MKSLLLLFISTMVLNGCVTTDIVSKRAEGVRAEFNVQELNHAFAGNKKDLLLCFYGNYRQDEGMGSKEDEGDYIVTLPINYATHKGRTSIKTDNCIDHINNLYTQNIPLKIFYIKIKNICHSDSRNCDWQCKNNSDCEGINWEISDNSNVHDTGYLRKSDHVDQNSQMSTTIVRNLIKLRLDNNAIFTVERSYTSIDTNTSRSSDVFDVDNNYEDTPFDTNVSLSSILFYVDNNYEIYNINSSDNQLHIELDQIYTEGNPIWYALTPFAVIFDIVTLPIQFIYLMNKFDSHF